METETETVAVTEVLVSGPAEPVHHPVENSETPETVYGRRDGTWMSFLNLKKISILNTQMCNE